MTQFGVEKKVLATSRFLTPTQLKVLREQFEISKDDGVGFLVTVQVITAELEKEIQERGRDV